jgi:hypothetical protein
LTKKIRILAVVLEAGELLAAALRYRLPPAFFDNLKLNTRTYALYKFTMMCMNENPSFQAFGD